MASRSCSDRLPAVETHQPSVDRLSEYRDSARARASARQAARAARRDAAWTVARRAVDVLRQRYGATRVVVFGSLADGTHFDDRSDIDVAAWGTAFGSFWLAVGVLAELDPEFEIDLIRAEEADRRLIAAIEADGLAL